MELNGVFGNAKFRHNFLRSDSGKVKIENHLFGWGKGSEAFLEKLSFGIVFRKFFKNRRIWNIDCFNFVFFF